MKFSIVHLSPIHKFISGILLIAVAAFLVIVDKFNFLRGVLFGAGLGLQLLAVIGFYKAYKHNQSKVI